MFILYSGYSYFITRLKNMTYSMHPSVFIDVSYLMVI